MENSVSEVIGKNLCAQPEPVARDDTRKYCDTCRFYNMVLSGNRPMFVCRRQPPRVIGNFIGLQNAGQLTFQEFTNTVWPVVGKDDWCGDHVDDPRAVRAPAKPAGLIATETTRQS
jgi:hypothetical protein